MPRFAAPRRAPVAAPEPATCAFPCPTDQAPPPHRHHPAPSHQVWNARGEQVGVVRAHAPFLAQQRIGPVRQLAFAPYELRLASGGEDSVVAVYSLDVGPAAAPATAPSPPRPPSRSPTPLAPADGSG